MNRASHWEEYELVLHTKGPVFIGSGKEYGKKSYILKGSQVTLVDEAELFAWLVETNRVDSFEEFALHDDRGLMQWLKEEKVPKEERERISRQTIDTANSLSDGMSLKAIQAFIRNGRGEAYIPGSSIKGAVCHAVEVARILDNHPVQNGPRPNILPGVMFADSMPIPDNQMILAVKYDRRKDNVWNKLNVVRECIRPGSYVSIRMTIDRTKTNIQAKEIVDAIQKTYAHYRKTTDLFPKAATLPAEGPYMFVGGGSGFFSKTTEYASKSFDSAVDSVSQTLHNQFRHHYHLEDKRIFGISPRHMKYALLADRLYAQSRESYEFGFCEVVRLQ